jgi:hypothetical protein
MKPFRALSFLRKPFGKPFGKFRVVSLSNRLTALSLSKGREFTNTMDSGSGPE